MAGTILKRKFEIIDVEDIAVGEDGIPILNEKGEPSTVTVKRLIAWEPMADKFDEYVERIAKINLNTATKAMDLVDLDNEVQEFLNKTPKPTAEEIEYYNVEVEQKTARIKELYPEPDARELIEFILNTPIEDDIWKKHITVDMRTKIIEAFERTCNPEELQKKAQMLLPPRLRMRYQQLVNQVQKT